VIERLTTELHDRDDPAVELEPERRECDRLHVACDLLRVLAGWATTVTSLTRPVARRRAGRSRRRGGANLAFDLGQVEFVRVLEIVHASILLADDHPRA